jgi:hypothetical protein
MHMLDLLHFLHRLFPFPIKLDNVNAQGLEVLLLANGASDGVAVAVRDGMVEEELQSKQGAQSDARCSIFGGAQ